MVGLVAVANSGYVAPSAVYPSVEDLFGALGSVRDLDVVGTQ